MRILGLAFAAFVVACSGNDPNAAGETVASSESAITTTDVLARGQEWVSAKLLYCQSANHAHDYDTACSSTCTREDNATWDPYRSDCSGFVSWSWGLPAPGRVTSEFAPFDTTVSKTINATDLQPGDAVNNSEHIMLFVKWITKDTEAEFFEEPGCSSSTPYAHSFTSAVTINGSSVYVSWNGMTFTSIHYDGITAPTPPPPTPDASAEANDEKRAPNGNGWVESPPPADSSSPTSTASGGCNSSGGSSGSGAWMLAIALLALSRRRP